MSAFGGRTAPTGGATSSLGRQGASASLRRHTAPAGEVVVIGAGHHGLVAALCLARAGMRVTVLERGEEPGGCIWTERHPSGVVIERGAVEHGGIAGLAERLGLTSSALGASAVRYRRHPVLTGARFADGEQRTFHTDLERTVADLGSDGERYRALAGLARALFEVIDGFGAPPTPTAIAASLAGFPSGDELFRTILQPADRVLEARLGDPHTRAALAVHASHAQVPAWAPGSGLFALLVPAAHGQDPARPVGGSGTLVDALVAALAREGARVRTGAEVVRLAPTGRGRGPARAEVGLADGTVLTADTVVSSVGARRTAGLLDGAAPRLAAAARQLHSGQFNIAELTVALVFEHPPELGGPDPDAIGYALGSPDDVGRTFAEVLAGRLPSSPWVMLARVVQPPGTVGGALWLSSVVPLRPAQGEWTDALETAAADRVVEVASAAYGTDLTDGLVDRVITGPSEWRRRIGGDGNPNHLDLTIDQVLGWRPPGHADGRTELPWLFLTGAGQHPGGGLSGASGVATADAVLSPRRMRRWPRTAFDEFKGLVGAGRAYLAMRRR